MDKVYLGDYRLLFGPSVYVEFENCMLKLTTDNGMGATNTIYFEERTLIAFLTYLKEQEIITWGLKDGRKTADSE